MATIGGALAAYHGKSKHKAPVPTVSTPDADDYEMCCLCFWRKKALVKEQMRPLTLADAWNYLSPKGSSVVYLRLDHLYRVAWTLSLDSRHYGTGGIRCTYMYPTLKPDDTLQVCYHSDTRLILEGHKYRLMFNKHKGANALARATVKEYVADGDSWVPELDNYLLDTKVLQKIR